MKILHLMVGLPRSGKSTTAQALGFPIVSPDAIRLAIHGTRWRAEVEPLVWATARIMVVALFTAGHDDVTLDACNQTNDRRRIWESREWGIIYHAVLTPEEICLKRAIEGGQPDLIPVIQRMARAWDPPGGNTDC